MQISRIITILFLTAFGAAPAALAVDGTVLINQSTSLNGLPGCPHTGFPIVICQSGSYRLSGALTVPTTGADAIDVTADRVTVDLNGFSITGTGATGVGVFSANDNTTITNGMVVNMNAGVKFTGLASLVERVIAANNRFIGIQVADGIVTRCIAYSNGSDGIRGNLLGNVNINLNWVAGNQGNGITYGGTVANNSVRLNNLDGIFGTASALLNVVLIGEGYGLRSVSGAWGNVVAYGGPVDADSSTILIGSNVLK